MFPERPEETGGEDEDGGGDVGTDPAHTTVPSCQQPSL